MSIRRVRLAFEDQYTQIPNQWARDERLSRKARGLLLELMSHRVGWEVSIESLMRSGPEGRDALRTAIDELRAAGYLRVDRQRVDGGKFGGTDYEIVDPWDLQGADEPTSDNPTLDDPTPKKNISSEDHPEEHVHEPVGDGFDAVWEAWPNKKSRKVAAQRWAALSPKKRAEILPLLTSHARAHTQHTPPRYIPMLATWLNQERWDDPLPTSQERGTQRAEPQAQRSPGIVIPAGHVVIRHPITDAIIGTRPA